MTDHFKPQTEQDITEVLAWALSGKSTLEIMAGGSKRGYGCPMDVDAILDLSALSGIVLYEPEELVLTVAAGTPLSEIDAALQAQGQELAFEPVDYGPLYGLEPGASTIGGLLAGNIAGSRRIKAGAARDHFLGVRAISGRGEMFKSGGRVVKNVTGYDLCKGLAGTWGTLAVMTEVTVKVLPAGEDSRSIVIQGLKDEDAIEAMTMAMGSAFEVSGAAHLPFEISDHGKATTVLRVEGFGPSVDYRAEQLSNLLKDFGPCDVLETQLSKSLWVEINHCRVFSKNIANPLWRLSVPPNSGAQVMREILDKADIRYFFDWAGGLIWIECRQPNESLEPLIRGAFADCGGHATLVRASDDMRSSVPVFQPQAGALAGLSNRLKDGFDPQNILNPNRMVGGAA